LAGSFDVCFRYADRDRAAVERAARDLTGRGLRVFLDRWYLAPGQPWPQALEQALAARGAVAVFVGGEGLGPWQQRERDLALDRQAREPGLPVVSVLLVCADPALGFLKFNTRADLADNGDDDAALAILAAAIRREPPEPPARQRAEAIRAAVCPYRGLQPLREEDEAFFFGRDGFAETLTARVVRRPFVSVVGASASGRSPVARAGLVPRLRRHPHRHRRAGRSVIRFDANPPADLWTTLTGCPQLHRPHNGDRSGPFIWYLNRTPQFGIDSGTMRNRVVSLPQIHSRMQSRSRTSWPEPWMPSTMRRACTWLSCQDIAAN
jgi:hypothetical protein